jgi:hypothetical protein
MCFILAFIIDLIILEGFSIDHTEELVERDVVDIALFQQMNITGRDLKSAIDYCQEEGIDYGDYLSRLMIHNNYQIDALGNRQEIISYEENNDTLASLYHVIMDDIACFPVVCEEENRTYYSNTFLAERTYGGTRLHMGIDIIDGQDEEGGLAIISMTDGVVEKIGWLELGGYRIGIRSDSGAYFYYAHLDHYADNLEIGNQVKSGDVIGYMGSTGYGEEGTSGEFIVHLHFGILLEIGGEEVWVNPYPILCMLDEKE